MVGPDTDSEIGTGTGVGVDASGCSPTAWRHFDLVWSLVLAIGSIVAALYLTQVSQLPRALRPEIDDSLSHAGLGGLVTGCMVCLVRALGWKGRSLVVGGLFATVCSMAFLVATELLQAASVARQPELSDAMADLVGAALAAAGLLVAFRLRPPVPKVTASLFLAAASVALVATTVAAARSSSAPVHGRAASALHRSEAAPNPCVTGCPNLWASEVAWLAASQ